ncbi:dTDP-4-amino-4,6-dideoxygalactose transaminase [Winogradskyella wandonensis]|uniref:dTDP-4-amino-4,6-dideoxygalactose transaminase n=1 Tax=Winogradskyella wandonensis TaxID=1442586 RepID=A0A4R1KVU2_9FLAO|nr:DegT/DnrJ/EryC1/StrS family aminotransferase [Winogradskyella wandonensis]TCK68823.1 dTDP-4-amino-4,6-dideoxygalactose transaminase [Winogradskyella wandonensis]
MINVTKTFLPPQDEFNAILKRAWDKNWITNRGHLVLELEKQLKAYLSVPNIIATTNGTLPLQIAIKALTLKGEIITTPFSYVATMSSIVWEGCTPVFVDIHPDYLTIDASKIESTITSETSAILATHVFGNPCNVETIEHIANKHGLKVIYDAAHSFGVTYKGQSIFNYGDVSTCSFHATKLFHSGEGGALFCNNQDLQNALFYHHNFGHDGPEHFQGLGINAKMSELQAAMGLAVLPYMNDIVYARKKIIDYYNSNLDFSILKRLKIREATDWNNSYYPLIFESEEQLLRVKTLLEKNNIAPRRYFYPSLNTIDYIKGKSMPISEHISKCIMCLPLYVGLKQNELKRIVTIINESLC